MLQAAAGWGLLGGGGLAWGETPEQLVRQLGSPRFEERHAAERRILEIPDETYAALQLLVESPNPEVQLRARRLFKLVQRQVLERRFARFAATGDLKTAPPGWDRFSEIVGDSPEGIRLYLAMFLAYPEILTSLAERSADVAPALLTLISDLYPLQQDARSFPTETLATALYLAASPDCPLDRSTLAMVVNLLSMPQVLAAVTAGDAHDPLQRILGSFVQRKDGGLPEFRFRLAQRFSLEDYLRPALDMVEGAAEHRVQRDNLLFEAIFYIAEHGTPENIADLEPLLEDSTKVGDWRMERTGPDKDQAHVISQVRDAALLASIRLAQQPPADFGFRYLAPSPKHLYVLQSTGFASDEEREKALEKWSVWRQRNAGRLRPFGMDAVEGDLL